MPTYRTFYRIVLTDPPTVRDVMSYEALGKVSRDDSPEVLRRWRGVSYSDTPERARKRAEGRPWIGDAFIATLDLPDGLFQIEKTGGGGHFTLWGDPHDILAFVTDVQRV